MTRPRRLALASLLALAAAGGAAAQGEAPDAVKDAAPSAERVDGENALVRLGIVTVGAFPIMLLYTDFSFDVGKFAFSGFDATYAPWPFKSEYAEPLSSAEKATRIGVAIGASVAVGAIDYLIRASKAKKARLRREALFELSAEGEASSSPSPGPSPAPSPAPSP